MILSTTYGLYILLYVCLFYLIYPALYWDPNHMILFKNSKYFAKPDLYIFLQLMA
jgi:hypothetical protein